MLKILHEIMEKMLQSVRVGNCYDGIFYLRLGFLKEKLVLAFVMAMDVSSVGV